MTTASPMTPHILRLMDPGPRAGEPGFVGGATLVDAGREWVPGNDASAAFVFPSERLARRYAMRFLLVGGETWMPVPAPGRASSVPPHAASCSGCGCTEAFAGPKGCTWLAPGYCSECAKGDPFPMWVVYEGVSDFPGRAVARMTMGGIPTERTVVGASLEEVRSQLPPGLTCIPRSPGDPAVVVECWL